MWRMKEKKRTYNTTNHNYKQPNIYKNIPKETSSEECKALALEKFEFEIR